MTTNQNIFWRGVPAVQASLVLPPCQSWRPFLLTKVKIDGSRNNYTRLSETKMAAIIQLST